ncbi:pentapeptide repeat-containing protein [Bradyrhizobium sp. Ash2021]|uniref:pentapeptide repeat-containing protein n=1 Tax=Bradyrhizobium sp. Ash2021 TaxID=2954771 RepID=UPI0035BF00B9
MIDFDATSGVDGVAAGGFAGSVFAVSVLAASVLALSAFGVSVLAASIFTGAILAGSDFARSDFARSDLAGSDLAGSDLAVSVFFGGSLATDETIAPPVSATASGFSTVEGLSAGAAAGWVDATGATAGAGTGLGAAVGGSARVEEVAGAACEVGAGPCRAIAPVTESRPCSSEVTREYSRSRSPLSVSIAEASRRVSFWLSLATNWICCACRVRSTAAICSRRHPSEDWLASTAMITAPTAPTPHDPIRHSAWRSSSSSSAKKPLSKPPVFSVSKLRARLSGSLAKTSLALLEACRITEQTLTGIAPRT